MTLSRRLAFARLFAATLIGSLIGGREARADNYEYDSLGRLKRVIYSDGTTVVYTYDSAGNRTQVTQGPSSNSPPTGTFSASPGSITPGGSSTLSWTSSGATSASIDNGVGAVTPVAGGSVSVSPSVTTTYALTLIGTGGVTTKTVTVTVATTGFNQTIVITSTSPANLRTLANAVGYTGAQNATITFVLPNEITILGAANGGRGIDTGTWPTGSYSIRLTLQISGAVYGGGGSGGNGSVAPGAGTAGSAGGDAIYCQAPITIVINPNGQLKGGGGGGGGGGGWDNGALLEERNGGGGGGGFPNGAGGAGTNNGSAGTMLPGGGGDGDPITVQHGGGKGGVGGGFASAGVAGGQGSGTTTGGWVRTAVGAGGAAGYAIRKNGNTVTVTNNGAVTGTVG